MKGLKSKLTQKLGPLPAWAWALVVVGLYLGWRFYQSKSGGNSPVAPAADPDNPSYYDGIYGGGEGGGAGGGNGGIGDPPYPDPPPPSPYPNPVPPLPGEVPDPPIPPHGAHGYKDPKKHPLHSKRMKGSKPHRVSTGVKANKSPVKHHPRKPVILHVKPKTTSVAVGAGKGMHPHPPQVPPHHAKRHKGRKG